MKPSDFRRTKPSQVTLGELELILGMRRATVHSDPNLRASVILLRYCEPEPYSYAAIARMYGVTRENIRQLCAQSIRRLKTLAKLGHIPPGIIDPEDRLGKEIYASTNESDDHPVAPDAVVRGG